MTTTATTAPARDVMLRAALDYAARGWHVFPVKPRGKAPLTKNGQDDSTTDPERIREWWTRRPNANVGVHCEPSGLYVVDIDTGDGKRGDQTWARLVAEHGEPVTYEVRTQAGGRHLYFRATPEQAAAGKLKSGGSVLGEHVDTRWNGYAIAPPSTGTNGAYTVARDIEPAPLPEWIYRAQCRQERPARPAATGTAAPATDAAVLARVAELAAELAQAKEGTRNSTASEVAAKGGQYVGAGQVGENTVIGLLDDAASRLNLTPAELREMQRTIRSQVAWGIEHPRAWEAPRGAAQPAARRTNVTDMKTRQPVTPREPDPAPEPEQAPGDLGVRYTNGVDDTFEQRPSEGRWEHPRFVEVRPGSHGKPETSSTILLGTLDVPERYSLRGIGADSYPVKDSAGTLYLTRYTSPDGMTYETPIPETELRATRDLDWPGRLGIDPFTGTAGLRRIPDGIRALAQNTHRGEAYTATGLLLRPGVPPVYLRQGRPALTGRYGVYDATAVTMLPGEAEALRGVALLRPPDPSTGEQAADDMLALFDVLSVTTGDPLVLVLLLAELAYVPWSSLPGWARNAIFLAAPTGLGKTILASLIAAWQSDTYVPTMTDSSAVTASVDAMSGPGARGILSQLRGLLASIDDFFPKGSSARELQRHAELLNVLGRGIKSGADDVKSQRDGALRAGRAMRTPVLATGEKFTDPTLSQSARYIHAELTPDVLALKYHAENSPGGRSEALSRVQAATAPVARAYSALIVEGLDALTDGDADRGPLAAARWAADGVGSWRLTGNNHIPPNYIGPMVGTYLIAERAGALGIADPAKVRAEFSEHLRRCASEQARRSVSRSAIAERYGDVIAEIIRRIRGLILDGNRFRLDGPTLGTPPNVEGYAYSTFGWREITREWKDASGAAQGSVSYEPLPRFGNPIGTVHQDGDSTQGRSWPEDTKSPTLRLRPDDWRRLYDAATEDATHLPRHDEARTLLAEAGYLKSRTAEPPGRGFPRVLTLDLGRVLAGDDDEGDAANDPGEGLPTPDEGLPTQLPTPDEGAAYAPPQASPQVSELPTLPTLPTLDSLARAHTRGTAAPLPETCPVCGRGVPTEWVREAYRGYHPVCAPAEVRTAGNAIRDQREARQPRCRTCRHPLDPVTESETGGTCFDCTPEPPGAARSRQEPSRPGHTTRPASGPQRAAQGRTAGALAVLDHDGQAFTLRTSDGDVTEVTTEGTRADLYRIARDHAATELHVHPSAAEAFGWPSEYPRGQRTGSALDVEGWTGDDGMASDPAGLASWTTVWPAAELRNEGHDVYVHVPGLDTRTPWRTARGGGELLAALTSFERSWGSRFYFSPNETARGMARRHSRRLAVAELPAPAVRGERDSIRQAWPRTQSRPLDDIEDGHTFVHQYDLTAQHVGAMDAGLFGNGTPEHLDRPGFNPRRAGYWRITGLTGIDLRLPQPDLPDGSWIVTETGKVLGQLGATFEVTEAWLYPEAGRYLSTVAERFRGALYGLGQAAADGQTGAAIARRAVPYKSFSGMLARQGGPRGDSDTLWRPDWNDVILATADANLLRAADRIAKESGRYPVATRVDALFYTSDLPDPREAAPKGMAIAAPGEISRIGMFKPEGTLPVAALRASFGESRFSMDFTRELERMSSNG